MKTPYFFLFGAAVLDTIVRQQICLRRLNLGGSLGDASPFRGSGDCVPVKFVCVISGHITSRSYASNGPNILATTGRTYTLLVSGIQVGPPTFKLLNVSVVIVDELDQCDRNQLAIEEFTSEIGGYSWTITHPFSSLNNSPNVLCSQCGPRGSAPKVRSDVLHGKHVEGSVWSFSDGRPTVMLFEELLVSEIGEYFSCSHSIDQFVLDLLGIVVSKGSWVTTLSLTVRGIPRHSSKASGCTLSQE